MRTLGASMNRIGVPKVLVRRSLGKVAAQRKLEEERARLVRVYVARESRRREVNAR
jgi:hypothetical protein